MEKNDDLQLLSTFKKADKFLRDRKATSLVSCVIDFSFFQTESLPFSLLSVDFELFYD